MSTNDSILTEKLTSEIRERWGFDQVAWIPLSKPVQIEFYDQWLKRGWNGEMEYLERHRAKKAEPTTLLAEARSIVVVTKSYVPKTSTPSKSSKQTSIQTSSSALTSNSMQPSRSALTSSSAQLSTPTESRTHGKLAGLRLASYAQSYDYHDWFKGEIAESLHLLAGLFPQDHFRHGTDSDPVLERDYAVQAGLGWWGKNTCVIDRKHGSFSFIGEILSTVAVKDQVNRVPDFCGTCSRCIEICPTQAIERPRELNATKCISYWTIESKGIPPENLRTKFGDWFFGCDLCQSVCPWNAKPFTGSSVLETRLTLPVPSEHLSRDLSFILSATDIEIRAHLKGTPLERAKPKGLRRNALIVIANRKMKSEASLVQKWLGDAELGDLAKWADQMLTASR